MLRYGVPPIGPVLVEPSGKYWSDPGYKVRCWMYCHPGGLSCLIPENDDHWHDEFDLNNSMRDDYYQIIENEYNDQRLVEKLVNNGCKIVSGASDATP